tara:strand:- start:707 stop:844 length:138 start_codon:yes stop_codon:yes gene_type:complete
MTDNELQQRIDEQAQLIKELTRQLAERSEQVQKLKAVLIQTRKKP